MIFGECFTNLDEYHRERWPEVFVAVPREGECVRAESGKILKVVRVTHYMIEGREKNGWGETERRSRIRVELHRTV
jgi:hypothetical protein